MFENIEYRENEKLSLHTTLHIGGNARWFLLPKDELELERIFYECKLLGIDCFILGAGSNLLVGDFGFAGAVISMENFNKIEALGNEQIRVQSGVNLFTLNTFCEKHDLGGLEWSYGIPGSVGGACKMNAGAFGGEFCKFISEIRVFNGISVKKRKNITYSYRKGCLKKDEVLISATLKLEKGERKEIRNLQMKFLTERQKKQPYGKFSLGSVFKRGEDFLPAQLIDEFGFKGLREGDIVVSNKHAGFFINEGKGTAKEFLRLTNYIENYAKEKGYNFEREFVSLGIFE